MMQSRTHTCGQLRIENAGERVTLVGWMENVRVVGNNFAFIVLRDFYGTTQIVVETEEIMSQIKGINKESTISVTGTVRENLVGVRVLRAFCREEEQIRTFDSRSERLLGLQINAGKLSALMNPLTLIIINAAVIILLQSGAIRVNSGSLTQGQVVALYNLMAQILVELIKMANLFITITKSLACADRVAAVMQLDSGANGGNKLPANGSPCGSVEFKNVSFEYKNAGAEALFDISFFAKPGQTVGIIGGTGSGKTTLVKALMNRFGDNISVLSHDNYYKRHDEMSYEERTHLNYDCPDAFDTDMMIEHLRMLKNGQAIDCPTYDYTIHNRADGVLHIEPRKVIVVEGILIFAEPELRERLDIKLFVDTDADVRILRRIVRDVRDRGRDLESIVTQYLTTVKPMHEMFVEPSKRYADIIIPEGGHNQVALDFVMERIRAYVKERD